VKVNRSCLLLWFEEWSQSVVDIWNDYRSTTAM